MAFLADVVPYPLQYNLKHNKVLHECVVLLTVRAEERPFVPESERIVLGEEKFGIWHIVVRYGFMESPRVLRELHKAEDMGLKLHLDKASFFVGRDRLLISDHAKMARWRLRLFSWLANNAVSANRLLPSAARARTGDGRAGRDLEMTMQELPGPVAYQLPVEPYNGLAIIGEAPGADEVRQGGPFVGRSGQLLNELLEEAGIQRKHTLIANVFRYQPPGNKVGHFFSSKRAAVAAGEKLDEHYGKMGSAYMRTSFAGELDVLKAVLEKYRPKAIVTLGGTALWAMTGLSGLTVNRGKWHESRLMPSTLVSPTFHPSFVIRGNWSARNDMLADIKMAKKKL